MNLLGRSLRTGDAHLEIEDPRTPVVGVLARLNAAPDGRSVALAGGADPAGQAW